MQSKQQSQFKVQFQFYIWSWLSYTTAQITIVIVTAKVTFHQVSLTSSKGRCIIKINFLLITESIKITTDH